LVNPRATRIALITASVPELTRRIFSMEGKAFRIISASVTSSSVGAPKLVPRPAAFRTAAITEGAACPKIIGPQDNT